MSVLENKKINFLGDSITEGCGTSNEACRFTNLIAARTGAICRNYGIGGSRIARQKNLLDYEQRDAYFCGRVEEMDADADAVVVFGGTNDFGHGDAPLGTFADRTVDTFYGAMHVLCTALLEKYPQSLIAFLTPLHRTFEDNPRGDINKAVPTGTLKEYIDIIREVTEYYSIPVLDLYAGGRIQPNVAVSYQTYTVDGLHPNDLGHQLLTNQIIRFLENNLY